MRSEKFNIKKKTMADFQSFVKTFIEDALEQGLLQTQHDNDGQMQFFQLAKADCYLNTEQPRTSTGQPVVHVIQHQLEHRTLKTLIRLSAIYRENLLHISLQWYLWSEPIAKFILEKMYEELDAPLPEWMIDEELKGKLCKQEFVFDGTSEDFYRALDHRYAQQKIVNFDGYIGKPYFDDRVGNFVEEAQGCFENATLEIWQKDKESENCFWLFHINYLDFEREDTWSINLGIDREKLNDGLKVIEDNLFCLRTDYKGRTYNISVQPIAIHDGTQAQILKAVYYAWSRNIGNYSNRISSKDGQLIVGKFSDDFESCIGIEFEINPTVHNRTHIKVTCYPLFEPMYRSIFATLEPYIFRDSKVDSGASSHPIWHNFDLQIIKSQSVYQARVITSPVGESMAVNFVLPFSREKLNDIILLVQKVRHYRSTQKNGAIQKQNLTIRSFGEQLFSAVFQGGIRTCLERSLSVIESKNMRLRLRLRLNEVPELMNLPWEYLYEPDHYEFLSLWPHLSIVRYLEGRSSETESPHIHLPLRILVVIASPTDQRPLDVEQEWTQIKSALSDLIQRGEVVLERLQPATLDTLQERMQQPSPIHIFHFLGHGSNSANGFGLILEDSNRQSRFVPAPNLAGFFRGHNSLRLSFLNACTGATISHESPFAGVAQSLVKSGLPAVIAMQSDITDQAAIKLAQWFYKSLANGFSVEAALAEARKAIFNDDQISLEWGIPVLYMRAFDGNLFHLSRSNYP